MTSPGEARVAAAAVPGCQHVLGGGVPCQDAVATVTAPDRVILAVADGHGDEQYTHSDEGARIAVAVAVEVLGLLADRIAAEPPPSRDASHLEVHLVAPMKRRIAFEWNRRVKHHARMIAARDGSALLWPDEVTGDWDEKVRAYGCTLLGALFTDDVGIWLRLGDGEALAVAGGDEGVGRVRRVFPGADKSMGQATHSLAMRSCIEHMDVRIAPRDSDLELVVLATDGVTDQYGEDPSFEHEWGARMLERIRNSGWTQTMMDLPRSLGTVARDGDDCSAAIAWLPPRSTSHAIPRATEET